MAKRHVVRYFLELENTYVEMQDTVKELQELAKEGKVEESMFLNMKQDLDVIKENYERVSYILFLLNKPNREKKQDYEEKLNADWYRYLKCSSKEAVVNESKDALSHFKKMVKELKDEQ